MGRGYGGVTKRNEDRGRERKGGKEGEREKEDDWVE